ncbi:baculoviral IAP repeat-containing protein 2/3 [Mytilus galloprovincialis]|uniref:Baculoviral IAP repeat-containing protein 2/3 n=1 Tax=Mytilus galloprovincialis TaxID=29158 RepID=A0A8B6EWR9_MYTGA|nr:baculoviral IAP repeat-containing protein 2/3 [Mytilus galloprovincialis]
MDTYFDCIANGRRTNDSMSTEMLRLFSLRNFPRNINISMVRLAGAGFYSTGNSTETKCFVCEVMYRDWISGDDPMHIHRQISPSCDLVVNSNRQDTIGEKLQNVRRRELLEVQPFNLNVLSSVHDTLHSNENNCLSNVLTSEQKHTDIGDITSSDRHFHHHDIVEDQPTIVSLQWSQSNTSNAYSDKNPTSNCKNNSHNIGKTNNSTACNYEKGSSNNQRDIGIQNQIPRYVSYAPLQVRISSFEGWPGYLNQTPREMALAGFLFAGYHDYTRCFHCGGGLRNWDAGDDPWVEHARWFPQCGFLKQNKGENFIQAVLKKHYMDKKGNENSTYSPKNHKEDRTVTSNRNTTMASTSVAGLDKSNMCTPNYQVLEQSNSSLGIQAVTDDSTTVTSRVNITCNSVSTTNMEHTERRILQTIAARTVIEMGFTSQQVMDAVNKIQRLNSGEGGTNVSATDIMNVLLREDHQQTTEVLNVQKTSAAEGSWRLF